MQGGYSGVRYLLIDEQDSQLGAGGLLAGRLR